MRTRLTALLAALAIIAMGAFVAGCGDDDDDDGDGGGANLGLIQEGQLLVGTDTPFPAVRAGQPPNISGFDIDVVNGIADKLGLEVTYQDTSFDIDLPRRRAGQVRHGRGGDDDHARAPADGCVVLDPYYQANQSLIVAAGSDTSPRSTTSVGRPSERRTERRARTTPTTRPTPLRSARLPRGPGDQRAARRRSGRRGDHRSARGG